MPKAKSLLSKTNTSNIAGGKQQRTLLSYFNKVTPAPFIRCRNDDAANDTNVITKKVPSPLLKNNTTFEDSEYEEAEENEPVLNPAKRIKIAPLSDREKQAQSRLLEKVKMLKVLDEHMGPSWFVALEKEFEKEYFTSLNTRVLDARNRGTVYPPQHHVWEWTRFTNIRDVKVVILGQDPYHGPGQAHGLCFSVLKVNPPPSLVNIYKELSDDIPGFVTPGHGSLIGWASQGVLLLNAVLTVQAHHANSHKDFGWDEFTNATIAWISQNLNNVVFLLWGAFAQKKAAMVDRKKHHLLQSVHPSPLSAHRGFFGCKHFSKCNELLKKAGKQPIDWNHLPDPSK